MIKSTWIGFVISLALSTSAFAQNTQDNSNLTSAVEVQNLGRSPAGIVPLLRLWQGRHQSEPAAVRSALEQIAADRRVNPNTRRYAQVLQARGMIERGEIEESAELITDLGYVNEWRVLGPFDNEGKAGFERAFPVETNLLEAPDPQASFEGRDRLITWQPYAQHRPLGYIDFAAGMRPQHNVCAYAQTVIHSDRAQALSLWVGAAGAARVWWNGEEVLEDTSYRSPDPERSVALVGAHRGANRVTLKVCTAQARWGFYFRVGNAQGDPARGIRVDAQSPDAPSMGHSRVRRSQSLVSSFDSLREASARESSTPNDWEALARFMYATGADDPAEERALQLAERAATESPTLPRLIFVTQLLSERSQITGWLNRAIALNAEDPRVLLLQARIMLGSPNPEEAIPLLDLHDPTASQRREAAEIRAAVYRALDLHQAAYQVIHDTSANQPPTSHWLALRADYANRARHRDDATASYERLLQLNHARSDAREYLIEDAIRREDFTRAAALLDTAYARGRHSVQALKYVARTRESIGDNEGASTAIEAARTLAPHDAGVLVAQGQLHLRAGRDGDAALALEAALRLRPQDAETRELLAQLQPAERADEQYAVPLTELLERRLNESGYPSTTLQNLTVNTVYPNGLGASFKQLAVQIHTQDGARQWRTYQIQFDPGSQRVDLRVARVIRQSGEVLEAVQSFERQMGEPWYRIYYDTRAKVVVFPDLEPGDTVEVQYRVDDVAHTNLFADYYGDLHILQNFQPITQLDYVLITPREREFFFNEPQLPSLQRSVREEGEQRIIHYRAENIEALRREAGMPGFTQVAPYLHVSTYRTWDDVGRWYWGLIQDQLYADENLETVVQELVADADSVEEKVARIYGWVIRNTRYVGLEFGIHGFKPYRVPLVLRRGFGDCKDKASILFTMLREAGIDAHIVLTRTRRNGDIGELPASLAVFDHAIAYVPELDLYLDGTAEHSGSHELPRMDQGVTVLHVWPSGSELRRTPVLPPEQNSRERVLHLQLQTDGSARARVEERVQGTGASTFRNQFQAVGTRVERMQRSMRQLFPGITVDEVNFETNLEDLEAPIVFSYNATIPRLLEVESGGMRLAPSVITELGGQIARSAEREHDLDLGGTSQYIEERHVELPAGASVASSPDGQIQEESPFGMLRITTEIEGNTIHTRTELVFARDRVSVEEYPAFREWVGRVDRRLRERLEITGGVR